MKRTVIMLFFFLLGMSEVCMGQLYTLPAMDLMLSNRVKELDKQIELLNVQLKTLIAQRNAAQKELDKYDKTMEEAAVNAPNFLVNSPIISKSSASVTPRKDSQSPTNKKSANDLDSDKRTIKNYINQGNSSKAYDYLKNKLDKNYPSDPYEQFGYAALLQDIIIGLTNDGTKAVYSMDFATSLSITCYLSGADQMQIELLAKAAANGHTGATQMLQLKSAMYGGGSGNMNVPYNSNSGSSSSPSTQKTCTLCNGKGWIAGSKTPTYGNSGTHWCSECARNVNASHSHDRCPSCSGRGYR